MNISSDFLFKLIFELSNRDTLSFVKLLETNNQLDCVELFQSIVSEYEKNPNLDISKFEKKLKPQLSSKISKYYRVTKSNLKKELLAFLSFKNFEKDNKFRIRGQINTGVSLAELGHSLEGIQIIEEAKEEAINNEWFEVVLYALDQIRRYKTQLRSKSETALAFNNEYKHYQNVLNNLNDYTSLSFYIFSFQHDFSADLKKIEALKSHDLLTDESKALSLTAKKFYYLSHLDILNALKQYDKMLDIVLAGVAYAEKANIENENFANTLLLMYERLSFVSFNLEKYDVSLKAIESMENFVVPKVYENSLFFYKLTHVVTKIKRLHIYSISEDENLYSYCKSLEKDIKNLKIGVDDAEGIYYKILFSYTVKLLKNQDACVLGKEYVKFVMNNIEDINPLNNLTIQSFLCYLISAYKNYTEDTFEYIFEYLFKKKNAKYFVPEDAPFHYVFKLYNVFIAAYKEGFYSEEVLVEYYDIWKEFPKFLPKANCIPKSVFAADYKNEVVEKVSNKYETVKFEC